MKIFFYSACLIMLISSCSPSSEKLESKALDSKEKEFYVKVHESCCNTYVKTIHEYTIDGCQYIGDIANSDSRRDYLTHKGNCTNPIHKL